MITLPIKSISLLFAFFALGEISKADTDVTYYDRVAHIIQKNCLECHRDGGVAPFSLETYDDVDSHAPMIQEVVRHGLMPPWFAAKSKTGHNPWANDRSLAKIDKDDLLAWITSGMPKGNVGDAPQPPNFAKDWQIGKPDAVFEFDKPVSIKASGTMPYVNVTVATNLDQDQWVQAVEILPSERSVVHHVLVWAEDGRRRGLDYWAVYVPGNGAKVYPTGFARRLPKGTTLRFQMHYTPVGKATVDQTRIGFRFAKNRPKHVVRTSNITSTKFRIPPHADNHQIVANRQIPFDVQILGFLPHHHLRGKASRYDLIPANGRPELLLDVPRYDFNWQLFYQYAEPKIVRRGDTLRFTAWYDNSADNPANPAPEKAVRWGEQTYDEMHVGYFEYTMVEPRDQ